MNRRDFLATLAAGTAGLVLDPERLLWVPGAKTIFLPPVRLATPTEVEIVARVQKGDIITIDGYYARNPTTQQETAYLQQFVVVTDVTTADAAFNLNPLDTMPRLPENLGKRRAKPVDYRHLLQPRDRGWSHKRT